MRSNIEQNNWFHENFGNRGNEINPSPEHLSEKSFDRYDPSLMERLLSTISKRLTYDFLMDSVPSDSALKKNIEEININLSENSSEASLTNALNSIEKTLVRYPSLLSYHIIKLNDLKELIRSGKKIKRSNIYDSLMQRFQNITPESEPSPRLFLTSKHDAGLLFATIRSQQKLPFMGVMSNENKKKVSTIFFGKLIDFELIACDLLKKQIQALRANLMSPADEALQALTRFKKNFYKTTELPGMNIAGIVSLLGETHKDKNFLQDMRNELEKLLTMEDKFLSITQQYVALGSLKLFERDIEYESSWKKPCEDILNFFSLEGLDVPYLMLKIREFTQILDNRITALENPENLGPTQLMDLTLPLFSVTSLLVENPNRFYLYQKENDFSSISQELDELMHGNTFVSEEEIEKTLERFMPRISPKENQAIVLEINLLKLLNQYSVSITDFYQHVVTPSSSRELATLPSSYNQYYYYFSLSTSVLHELESLKNILQKRIILREDVRFQFKNIESFIKKLMDIEQSVRSTSFMLSLYQARFLQQDNTPALTKSFEELNRYYRNTESIQHNTRDLEKKLIEKTATLLYETDSFVFLTTPSQLIFSKETNENNNKSLNLFKRYPDKLCLFVQDTLLKEEDNPFSRSKIYARWLSIAAELHKKSDFIGYYAITIALYNMTELKCTLRYLDEDALKLFREHVKVHNNFMPIVLKSPLAIPCPVSFLGEIERIAHLNNQSGFIGYWDKKDSRLYGSEESHLQKIYRFYQTLHQNFLEKFRDDPSPSDWHNHIETIHAVELSVDSGLEFRKRARKIEEKEKIDQAPIFADENSFLKPNILLQIEKDHLLYLSTQIEKFPHSGHHSNQERSDNVFNSYVSLRGLANTADSIEKKLRTDFIFPVRLDAFRCQLFTNPDATHALFAVLKRERFQFIRELDLSSNLPSDLEIEEIREYLTKLPQLLTRTALYNSVRLSNNFIDNQMFAYHFLPRHGGTSVNEKDIRIERLSLEKNRLGFGDYSTENFALARFLQRYKQLVFLDLNENFLGERDAGPLATALVGCHSLREIDLGMNAFGDKGIAQLCETLKTLPKLEVVKLHRCELTDNSVDVIKNLINDCPSIIRLIIDGNEGMTTTSYMYLMSLLAVKQDQIIERAKVIKQDHLAAHSSLSNETKEEFSSRLTPDQSRICSDSALSGSTPPIEEENSVTRYNASEANDVVYVPEDYNEKNEITTDEVYMVNRLRPLINPRMKYKRILLDDPNLLIGAYDFCLLSETFKTKNLEYDKLYFVVEKDEIKYRTTLTPGHDLIDLGGDISRKNGELYKAIRENRLKILSELCKNEVLKITSGRCHTLAGLDHFYMSRLSLGFVTHPCFSQVREFFFNNQEVSSYTSNISFEIVIDRFINVMSRCIHIELEKDGIDGNFLGKFYRRLRGNNNMRSLSLACNKLGETESDSHVLSQLMESFALQRLNIQSNSFTEKDAKNIAQGITACVSLQEIYLSHNHFGNEGIKKIFEAIATHPNIHTVTLDDCGMTQEINSNTQIPLLHNLFPNTKPASSALLETVTQNTNIRKVVFGNNDGITESVRNSINEILVSRDEAAILAKNEKKKEPNQPLRYKAETDLSNETKEGENVNQLFRKPYAMYPLPSVSETEESTPETKL